MKWPAYWLASCIVLGVLVLSLGCDQSLALPLAVGQSVVPAIPATTSVLPVTAIAPQQQQSLSDRYLHRAQTLVRYLPEDADGYNQLVSASLLKSRETGDFSYVAKATLALEQSLRLQPDNGEALKLQLMLQLTEHRFREALDLARRLQSRFPQDPQIETALIDALVEVGDYPAANASAKAALALRPGAPVYARLSYLRSLQGDQAGAIAAMTQAVETANPSDREGYAWYLVHLGTEQLNAGDRVTGERAIDQALQGFPEYPLALAAKARARLTAEDWEQAIAFFRRSEEQMPLPDTAMALGDLYQSLGQSSAAQQQYDLVDFLVQAGGEPFQKAYAHQLALFWADQGTHLEQALALIQQERLTRADIYTFDALAWCLFKLGRLVEAKEAIAQALRLGTPDARILYHAGQIYHSSGEPDRAKPLLQQALKLNPVFHPLQAAIAREVLDESV